MSGPVCCGCGRVRERTTFMAGPGCRNVRLWVCCYSVRVPARGERERLQLDALIDWRAVEYVIQGGRVPSLNGHEQRIVVRHLAHRIIGRGDNTIDLPPWALTCNALAERMGVTVRHVERHKAALPPATKHRCPDCRGPMWVDDRTGIVEQHGDGFGDRCTGSDRLGRNVVSLQPVPQAMLVLRCYALAVSA